MYEHFQQVHPNIKINNFTIALKTYEGSRDELVQADPELTAKSFTAINKLSPSTNENEALKL